MKRSEVESELLGMIESTHERYDHCTTTFYSNVIRALAYDMYMTCKVKEKDILVQTINELIDIANKLKERDHIEGSKD